MKYCTKLLGYLRTPKLVGLNYKRVFMIQSSELSSFQHYTNSSYAEAMMVNLTLREKTERTQLMKLTSIEAISIATFETFLFTIFHIHIPTHRL